jgi:hypothetical protein
MLHHLDQSAIATRFCENQMKVCITLNLLTIFFSASSRCFSRLFDYSLKAGEVIVRQFSQAQLNGKKIQRIQQREHFGVVRICPTPQIHPTRWSPLDNTDLFQTMKRVTHWRSADLKSASQVLLSKSLIRNESSLAHLIKDLKYNPVRQRTIDGLLRKAGRFVEQIQEHLVDSIPSQLHRCRFCGAILSLPG